MLLLTDRPKHGFRLRQIVDAVEPCTLVGPGQTAPVSPDHGLIICDAALDNPVALAALQAVLAHHRIDPMMPVLCLVREQGAMAQAEAIGATAVLPRDASDAQILFTVRRMTGSGRDSRMSYIRKKKGAATAAKGARETALALHNLFTVARQGGPLERDSLTRGGDAVVAAVGGGRIGAWLDVVRTYDDMTYQHCLLVAGLAAAFSIRLGVTLKGQRLIAQAALVHDIGKASIPRAILNKPAALSPSEMEIMRTHPAVGHDMLVHQGGFSLQLLDIVRHHHEYVDGSGYPDGLSGEKVSAVARLVTICDIYAALIERRSYKAPKPPRDAMAILAGMGGKLDAGLLLSFRELVFTT